VASKTLTIILQAATNVFAKQGFHGATVPDIALHADVAEVTIYRHFFSKEKLFAECLIAVVEQSLNPVQFEAVISELRSGDNFGLAATRAVRRWYFSISAQSARLLMQAALSDNKEWAAMAFARLETVVGILAKAAERQIGMSRGKALVAARTLIFALFQFKVSRPLVTSSNNERDSVDKAIQQWLRGLP
jgi:AcrR family transcriptional regulator